jgi:hypothetical protein
VNRTNRTFGLVDLSWHVRRTEGVLVVFENIPGNARARLDSPCCTFSNLSKSYILPVITFAGTSEHTTFRFGVSWEDSRHGTSSHQANCKEC